MDTVGMPSPRENFHAMLRGEAYARLPLDLPMTPPVLDEMERRKGTRDTVEAFGTDFRGTWVHSPDRTHEWREVFAGWGLAYGRDVRLGNDGYAERVPPRDSVGLAWHLTEMLHPLSAVSSVSQLENLPWSDPAGEAAFEALAGQVAQIEKQGLVSVCHCECTFFERAWYTRGMDHLIEDWEDDTGIADWLMDHFTELSCAYVAQAARAGVDLIRLGDDVGTQHGMMVSVPMWRTHFKPRLARVIESARAHGNPWIQYHSDGDVREIIGDLIEIGVDILNPVQPECMPFPEVASRWSGSLAFSGMIGTQTTMPFGSPDDVRNAVRELKQWASRGARMIVAPTHVLEPDVPWENIEALAEAVRA